MDVSVRPHRDRSFQRSNCGLIGVSNILGAAATYLRTSVGAYWHFAALFVFVSAIIVEGTIMVNAQPRGLLELSQTIVLTDVRGRIDHMDIDIKDNRLFVAALGNNSVEIIDLTAGRSNARLQSLHEPQGVLYLPSLGGRLYVANGQSGQVDVFSGTPLTLETHIGGLEDADNLRYDPARAAVFAGTGTSLVEIDGATTRIANRIRLKGHPESFQLETGGTRIFVNVPSAGHIAVIDREKQMQIAAWDLGDMHRNFPMALDEPNHRLYVATRQPPALLAYDTESGKRVGGVPIANDADDLFYDGKAKRLYVVCGEGVVDVLQQIDGGRYERVERLRTAPGARTGLFVPALRTLYVAVPQRGVQPAEIRVYAAQ